jgi:acetyl-CoA acetyltransferase
VTQVDVVGVGMHPFGRFEDRGLKDLVRVAVINAIVDAGIGVKDIQAAYAANSLGGALTGQEQIRGQAALRDVGIESVPVVNVENACAGGSTAFGQAVMAIRAGAADVVLAIGFEKMYVTDREAALIALRSAADLDVVDGLGLQFTAVYALRLRKRLDDGSLQLRHLVDATVKARANGARNPFAQHRQPITADDVMKSRPIAEPLTRLMCGSMSDGAAAAIVARSGVVHNGRPPVRVRASASRSGHTTASVGATTAELCARAAYDEAGVDPADLDLLEVHDAMAPGELLYYEQLGLCEPGAAGHLLDAGVTALGGRQPVNPSGGLSARGHPVAATGLAQIAELTWQLRGEAGERQVDGARLALAQNSGGWLEGEPAACNVHVLERRS